MSFKPPTYRPRVPPPPLFPAAGAGEGGWAQATSQGAAEVPPAPQAQQGRQRAQPSYATRRQSSARAPRPVQSRKHPNAEVLQAVIKEKNDWETQERPLLEQQVALYEQQLQLLQQQMDTIENLLAQGDARFAKELAVQQRSMDAADALLAQVEALERAKEEQTQRLKGLVKRLEEGR